MTRVSDSFKHLEVIPEESDSDLQDPVMVQAPTIANISSSGFQSPISVEEPTIAAMSSSCSSLETFMLPEAAITTTTLGITKERHSCCLVIKAAKAMKSLALKPYNCLCATTLSYKQHFNLMVITNLSSKNQVEEHIGADSESTSYGSKPASDEDLRKQCKRYHLAYIFGLGPEKDLDTTQAKTTKKHPRSAPPRLDARTLWEQSYNCDTRAEIEHINKKFHQYLLSIGFTLQDIAEVTKDDC